MSFPAFTAPVSKCSLDNRRGCELTLDALGWVGMAIRSGSRVEKNPEHCELLAFLGCAPLDSSLFKLPVASSSSREVPSISILSNLFVFLIVAIYSAVSTSLLCGQPLLSSRLDQCTERLLILCGEPGGRSSCWSSGAFPGLHTICGL